MLKVLSIFGTRPEAIKLAPVIQALRAAPAEFESRVCVTGQHRQLLDPVLRLFDIRPDSDLKVMQPDQSLAELTARLLSGLAPVLAREKPDWVLIQGDTTTTLSAALAAYYQRFPVAHVEAGLRSHNPWHPYPEEFNRRLADALSTLHLAPTEGARRNLLAEGIPAERIRVTGNTVMDALLDVAARPHDFARAPPPQGPPPRRTPGPRQPCVCPPARRPPPPLRLRARPPRRAAARQPPHRPRDHAPAGGARRAAGRPPPPPPA